MIALPTLVATSVVTVLADVTTPDPDTVTPGIIGFVATFGIALITLFLIIDMVRRVRRVNYRAQVREELEAELAAQAAQDATGSDAERPNGTTEKKPE
ncbi:hypothetical protein [Herbiconiux solani]|uniref:hypothetical protein n=1 Tax=Herbiconiux solani TaxID=661329 RepID=UPI000825C94B|nr:hypothetical protein [Herbiconiux solani]